VPDTSSQGIFISYRREDAAPYARLLQKELRERFPDARVFMDLDSIEAGVDFVEVIQQAVSSCAALVALIGRQWATLTNEAGDRRLDNPDDFVRFEIQTALERGVRVIPVLVDDARPLRQQELPAELHKLPRLNALELSYGRYDYDAERLFGLIQRVLAEVSERKEPKQKQAHVPAQLIRELTGHGRVVSDVAFSPDGTLLASCGMNSTVRLWEVVTGTPIRTLRGHNEGARKVAFSPDGTLIASCGDFRAPSRERATSETVLLWQVATGTQVRTLTGHSDRWVPDVAFSPDGTLLASCASDSTVRLWQVATGTQVRTLGHPRMVESVAFSPDGTLLATAGADGTVRLWQVTTGAHVQTLTGHDDRVKAVAFSPDGTLLATAGADGTVRLWS
jgi:WD40 repeat protein